jgi:hypothetical protein
MKVIKIPRRESAAEPTKTDDEALADLQKAFRQWGAAHDWNVVGQAGKHIEELRVASDPWRRDLARVLGQLTPAQLQHLPQFLSVAGRRGRPPKNREQELAEQARQFAVDHDRGRAVRALAELWNVTEHHARRKFIEHLVRPKASSKPVRKIR